MWIPNTSEKTRFFLMQKMRNILRLVLKGSDRLRKVVCSFMENFFQIHLKHKKLL